MSRIDASLPKLFVGVSFLLASILSASAAPLVVEDDFSSGTRGWTVFFVDHPPGVETDWEMEAGLRPLPDELGLGGTGLMVTGNNHSDDLGMALKKVLGPGDGIVANQTYWVEFELSVASNAASGSFGVGGSPGDSVYLKAGASATEPDAVLEPESQHLRPNVNVGFQSVGGPAATVTGTIANGRDANEPARFVVLNRTHRHAFPVRADQDGRLWLLVMTDSAFEGPTTLYYLRIRASLTPVTVGDGAGLVNLSTRGVVGAGDDALIAGFAVRGAGGAPYLVRAVGPGLEQFDLTGTLPNPRIEVVRHGVGRIADNDDWPASPQLEALRAAMAAVGAFPLPEQSADAALRVELGEGIHSAIVRGADESEGLALVELYSVPGDADGASRLVNLSTRGRAGTEATALIAGLGIGGSQPERVLIRAVGPGLAAHGIASPSPDPILTLYQDQEPIATNQAWESVNAGAEIAAAASAAGAFALAPGSRDAALLVTLTPGSYTIMVEDADTSAARTALVEIYHVP